MQTVIVKSMKMSSWLCPSCGDVQYEDYEIKRKTVNCKHCGNIYKFNLIEGNYFYKKNNHKEEK